MKGCSRWDEIWKSSLMWRSEVLILGRIFIRDERRFRRKMTVVFKCFKDVCEIERLTLRSVIDGCE